MELLSATTLFVVGVACCIVAWTDLRDRRIRNTLTFPLIVGGVAYHSVTLGWEGFQGSVLGVCVGFGVLIAPYLMGGVGGGDLKFMAGVGAWLGMMTTLVVFLFAAVLTGAFAIIRFVTHPQAVARAVERLRLTSRRVPVTEVVADQSSSSATAKAVDEDSIPFGAMIAIGLLLLIVAAFVVR